MFKRILIVLVIAVACIGVLAMRQPDSYTVERRATMSAPPQNVFALVNDFRQWSAWSPWATKDPNMQLTISERPDGVGASYEWHGNGEVGAGRMEIKESLPPNRVTIDLHFLEPIDSRSVMLMQIEPAGTGSTVIWTMRGDQTLLSRVMSVFTSMDAMVGPDFDRGLKQLETASAKAKP